MLLVGSSLPVTIVTLVAMPVKHLVPDGAARVSPQAVCPLLPDAALCATSTIDIMVVIGSLSLKCCRAHARWMRGYCWLSYAKRLLITHHSAGTPGCAGAWPPPTLGGLSPAVCHPHGDGCGRPTQPRPWTWRPSCTWTRTRARRAPWTWPLMYLLCTLPSTGTPGSVTWHTSAPHHVSDPWRPASWCRHPTCHLPVTPLHAPCR